MTFVAGAVAGLTLLAGCSSDAGPSGVSVSQDGTPSDVRVTVSATVSHGAPFEVTAPSNPILVEPGGTATFALTFQAGSVPVYMDESNSNSLRWVLSEVTDGAFFAARGPESLTFLDGSDGEPLIGVLDVSRSMFLEPSTLFTDEVLVHAGLDEEWATYKPLTGTFTHESRVEYVLLERGQDRHDLGDPVEPDGHATVTLTYEVEGTDT